MLKALVYLATQSMKIRMGEKQKESDEIEIDNTGEDPNAVAVVDPDDDEEISDDEEEDEEEELYVSVYDKVDEVVLLRDTLANM